MKAPSARPRDLYAQCAGVRSYLPAKSTSRKTPIPTEYASMKSTRQKLKSATKPKKESKLSRVQAPADLSHVDWQRGLRRQFGREQTFGLENLGGEPFFSEFRVSNPVSKSSYRVEIGRAHV